MVSALRAAGGAAAFAFLAGCGAIGMPIGGDLVASARPDPAITGSIAPAPLQLAATASVTDPGDWEAIRLVVASEFGTAKPDIALGWANPLTGSSGTVTALADLATEGDAARCRPLTAIINDLHGVRRYSGEACLARSGGWVLDRVRPDDAQVL